MTAEYSPPTELSDAELTIARLLLEFVLEEQKERRGKEAPDSDSGANVDRQVFEDRKDEIEISQLTSE